MRRHRSALPARLATVALVLSSLACVHFPPSMQLVTIDAPADEIVFHDVSVFTATSRESLTHQDVVVRDGLIASVTATQPLSPGTRARIFEGQGRTLMPGLIDVHTHPTGTGSPFYRLEVPDPKRNLEAELYVGVTTIDVAGGDPAKLSKLAQQVETHEILGPRIYFAGLIITAKDGYPPVMIHQLMPWPLAGIAADGFAVQVTNADEARAAVRRNIAGGASFIKVAVTNLPDTSPRLDERELEAVVDEAHGRHLQVVAHVDTADDALLCARTGVDALWHDVQLDALTPDQVHELALHLHTVVPTLSTFDAFDNLVDGNIRPTPLLRATESPGLVQSLIDAPAHKRDIPPRLAAWMMKLHANHQGRRANAKALFDAGVTILVGTDADGADGAFPANIHEELIALHDAGLSNADILLGATSRAARFLEPNATYGTIEPGKSADLLLVDGDPLADIHATSNIVAVVARGRLLARGPGFSR